MSNRKQQILQYLSEIQKPMNTTEVAESLKMDRTNASRCLKELALEGKLERIEGRPVLYRFVSEEESEKVEVEQISFDHLVGVNDSLKVSVQQAKAAILYPPNGLHTIIFGETGTGKSLFAECMYRFAVSSESLQKDAPFITFNCADYAQNPQLLFSTIFGVKKGAYTGAVDDREGLIAKADGGILFLDEIHRLPPEGQEMLFTFIDKGIYRPLGESEKTYEATVQIIGATTESSEIFLTTFNRRIPMAITLPSLEERSIDERYEIVTLFIKQEVSRLNRPIQVERDVIFAFMLYHADGNIGQVKRDLKLVCAKAFLNYRMDQLENLEIKQKDLPLHVQKGLLKIKSLPDRGNHFIDSQTPYLTFYPGKTEVVWSKDPTLDMGVYDTIDDTLSTLSKGDLASLDLEKLIEKDEGQYFQTYVAGLSKNDIHRELLSDELWQLTDELFALASEKLNRTYNEKIRFTFALHLQSTLERIKKNKSIIHPNLNEVRKKYSKEFQVAIDLSAIIEEKYELVIPFDEIGFITMFLALDMEETVESDSPKVEVVVMMHGRSTASSMLETVQELLDTKSGVAFNMPLTMEVSHMYEQLKNYVLDQKELFQNGVLLLTDMGSLNNFSNMLYEETGIRTRAISMVSTMIVLEAVRLAENNRSLEDIYQSIQLSFENIIHEQFYKPQQSPSKKAVIVTCFTGEGVAVKLQEYIEPVLSGQKIEIIPLQFLEREAFKKRIDELMGEYEIKAIVGTVDIEYQSIPFFSAFDIFNREKLDVLTRVAIEEIPLPQMIASLEGTIRSVPSVEKLLLLLQKVVQQIQFDLHVTIEPGIIVGIILHMAFLIDRLALMQEGREFKEIESYKKKHLMEMNIVKTNLMILEKQYQIQIPEDEIAFLTRMFLENQLL